MKNAPTVERMIERDQESKWHMPGTEGTGEYVTILETERGVIGYRLPGGRLRPYVRVRVQPANAEAAAELASKLTRVTGWKQPGDSGQNRFSHEFYDADSAIKAIEKVIEMLGSEGKERRGGSVRYWRQPIQDHFTEGSTVA